MSDPVALIHELTWYDHSVLTSIIYLEIMVTPNWQPLQYPNNLYCKNIVLNGCFHSCSLFRSIKQ